MERTNVHIISAGCITRVMHTGEWTVLRLFREAEKQQCTERVLNLLLNLIMISGMYMLHALSVLLAISINSLKEQTNTKHFNSVLTSLNEHEKV